MSTALFLKTVELVAVLYVSAEIGSEKTYSACTAGGRPQNHAPIDATGRMSKVGRMAMAESDSTMTVQKWLEVSDSRVNAKPS